eukprot:TRINITY_DN93939_c0_g1_i1.p1 TRINITY_DN93939_c0_g1~~TRINITY_DN93939_c0_g1_i1.p1  ORF type:complete len:115 (+),score=14.58 TRINITY_DN93939_c0_g1_i1:78-422(+)
MGNASMISACSNCKDHMSTLEVWDVPHKPEADQEFMVEACDYEKREAFRDESEHDVNEKPMHVPHLPLYHHHENAGIVIHSAVSSVPVLSPPVLAVHSHARDSEEDPYTFTTQQ